MMTATQKLPTVTEHVAPPKTPKTKNTSPMEFHMLVNIRQDSERDSAGLGEGWVEGAEIFLVANRMNLKWSQMAH